MVASVKDPVIEIAQEMRTHHIRELSLYQKRELCERAKRTFNERLPEEIRYLENTDLLSTILNSHTFADINGIPFKNIGEYILDIRAAAAHLALRYAGHIAYAENRLTASDRMS